jgi:hypothetical protein
MHHLNARLHHFLERQQITSDLNPLPRIREEHRTKEFPHIYSPAHALRDKIDLLHVVSTSLHASIN